MARLRVIHEAGDAAKAETREVLELIVRLQNVTHLADTLRVLVFLIQGMQRSWVTDLTVGSSKVNGDRKRNLPSRPQIVDEVRILNHSEVIEVKHASHLSVFDLS